VLKRLAHFKHSRRRRITLPSEESRESMTLVSVWLQKGQTIKK